MALVHVGSIDLPAHVGQGGFDHAAVDSGRALLYVAHTANDSVDVIDLSSARYLRSIDSLTGVAGALVQEPEGIVFTSNRGENTVGILDPSDEHPIKVPVGIRPNGLAFDPGRGILLCANVGDPAVPGSASVTLVDVRARSGMATVSMPGRTRWAIYDPDRQRFFVNIMDPAVIMVLDPARPDLEARPMEVPARGPHGLDLDRARGRLYCACDDGTLVVMDGGSGSCIAAIELSGPPDVVFLNPALAHLYAAIGDPGVIDVVDVAALERVDVVATEHGCHTIGFDQATNRVYAFCPRTHRASVYAEDP